MAGIIGDRRFAWGSEVRILEVGWCLGEVVGSWFIPHDETRSLSIPLIGL